MLAINQIQAFLLDNGDTHWLTGRQHQLTSLGRAGWLFLVGSSEEDS